jgi:flagellar basal body-associated protein FliL
LGFFFFILIALIASRLVEFAYARGGRLPPFTWRWMGNYIFLALGVALVAIILGWLLITPAKFVVSQGLFVVLLVIILAAVVVAAPVFLVLWLLTPWLTRIYEQGWVEMSRIQVPETAPEFEEGKLAQVVETAPNWLITALIIAGILLISAIVIAILVLLRKRQDKMGLELDEDIETVPSRWLRWLPILRRGNRPMAKTARLLAAARIRRMYAELMTFSTRLGKPRPAAQTPLEYLPTLESLFPQQAYELDNLTRAYLKVRYGELPESHEELELLEGQWRILRQEAEHLLRIQRQATLKK